MLPPCMCLHVCICGLLGKWGGQQSSFLNTGNVMVQPDASFQCLFMYLLRAEYCTYARDTGGGPYPVRVRGDPRVQT